METPLKVGLVGCVKQKRPYKRKAKNLYVSDLFQKSRVYVEKNYDTWFILSAKHHLLDPEDEIEPYEETLNEIGIEERKEWSKIVFDKLRALYPDPTKQIFMFHAGERYREFLVHFLKECGYQFEVPLEGLGIGKQLSWYLEQDKPREVSLDRF